DPRVPSLAPRDARPRTRGDRPRGGVAVAQRERVTRQARAVESRQQQRGEQERCPRQPPGAAGADEAREREREEAGADQPRDSPEAALRALEPAVLRGS